MDSIGTLLIKALSRNCSLELPDFVKKSSLELYLYVVSNDSYDYNDVDLGVPFDITAGQSNKITILIHIN